MRQRHAFYPFNMFSLRPGVYGTGRSDLQLPSYMLVSHNHFRYATHNFCRSLALFSIALLSHILTLHFFSA